MSAPATDADGRGGPLTAATVLFALLVVGAVGAFFVAQKLKNEPAVVGGQRFAKSFSPNGDGRRESVTFSFFVKRSTSITVQVVDGGGRTVRTLEEGRDVQAYRRQRVRWDGRQDDGRIAEDGRYRFKVTLTDEGRSIVTPGSFAVDTTPPRPRVRRLGDQRGSRPMLLPTANRKPFRADLVLRGWYPQARIVRTSPGPARIVRRLAVKVTREADGGTLVGGKPRSIAGEATWDGTLPDGRPAPAGTYVLQVCVRDQAANLGCGPAAADRDDALPKPEPDGRYHGRGGITVRPIGVQPRLDPVDGDHRLTFFVDARGRRYQWVLRRIGARRDAVVARGSSREPLLRPRTRSARSAGYVLSVSVDGERGLERVEVPAIATDSRAQRVLVVLPAITWVGRVALDDDGDGLVDVLGNGPRSQVRRGRVMTGLPQGFDDVRAVLRWLAAEGVRYDLTTDLALAAQGGGGPGTADGSSPREGGGGPRLDGHRGVLLVGEHRWTTTGLADRLRRYVRGGGSVGVLDPASLHRTVTLGASRLRRPGAPTADDAFGIESAGAVRLDGPLQIDGDEIGLFTGTDGRFDGYPTGWPARLPDGATKVAGAVDGRDRLIVAGVRIDRGLVLRTGLPAFASRLADDRDTSELLSSTWRRLSR